MAGSLFADAQQREHPANNNPAAFAGKATGSARRR
jgi:hypothetical protein